MNVPTKAVSALCWTRLLLMVLVMHFVVRHLFPTAVYGVKCSRRKMGAVGELIGQSTA